MMMGMDGIVFDVFVALGCLHWLGKLLSFFWYILFLFLFEIAYGYRCWGWAAVTVMVVSGVFVIASVVFVDICFVER